MKHWSWPISHGGSGDIVCADWEVNKDLKLGVFWVVRGGTGRGNRSLLSTGLQAKHTHISRGGGGARRKADSEVWGSSVLPSPLTVRVPAGNTALLLLIISTYFFAFTTWEQYGVAQSLSRLRSDNAIMTEPVHVPCCKCVVCCVCCNQISPDPSTHQACNTPHLSSTSTSTSSFSKRLDWIHFTSRMVDVSQQQIHSFNPLPSVQTWSRISEHWLPPRLNRKLENLP